MPDQKSSVENFEGKINKELYGIDNKDSFVKDIKDIEDSLNKINKGYSKFVGTNLIEFLSKMEFNTNNSDIQNTLASRKKKLDKGDIEKMLSKDGLSQIMNFEKDRFARYDDYSLIYSYIPQLAECINVFRDCIMSPDDLTKNSLNVLYKNLVAKSDTNNDVVKNLNKIIKKYDLNTKGKNVILNTLKLGDFFVAVLKYDEEFNKMLLTEDNGDLFIEDDSDKFKLINEDIEIDEDFKYVAGVIKEDMLESAKGTGEKPEVSKLYSDLQGDIAKILNNNVKFNDDPRKSLVNLKSSDFDKLNKTRQKRSEVDGEEYTDFGISGSVIRMLQPDSVIKLEVDGINFGYIYIEKTDDFDTAINRQNAIGDFFNSRTDIEKSKSEDREDVIANIFIKGISKKIDNDLIKDSKEFKDYIYTLLKQKYITEKAVKITYLTPDEVVHFMTDTDEMYGQSKLSRSLFFAKLYLATLITELMQKISRGRDKRLVYVETGLDDDIEGVIQGVVKDIKSKEIQTDVLKSITTILNSIGTFDDYYIPLVDGEKPLDFDTLQGMDVDADNEFLQFLLKSAIGGTGVPVNYIDATQEVDFARTLAMQNSTFVRTIVSDQATLSESFSKLVRILYKNEYMSDIKEDKEGKKEGDNKKLADYQNIDLDDIHVVFPAPISLNLTNVNDQINNSSQTLDFITGIYVDENDVDSSNKKLKFRQKVVRELLPNIDWDKMDKLFEESEMDSTEESLHTNDTDEGGMGDDEGGGGGFGGGF
jgi:hypothetical protein